MNLTFIRHLFLKDKKRGSILFKKTEHVKVKVNKPDLTIKIKLCAMHMDVCAVNGKLNINRVESMYNHIKNCVECKVEYL